MWGGKKRLYSATKFILYTAGSSAFLLIGALGIALYGSNEPTFNFETSANQSYPVALEIFFYIVFLIAFAVKLPIIPFHTWLPDTHGEAHYSTCMLLAGILLKMGAYGLIRINMEFLPHAHSIFSPFLIMVGAIQIIYAASTSSGICSMSDTGLNGAVLQIVSHGFIGAALFFLAGAGYDRTRLAYLDNMGGLAATNAKIVITFIMAVGMILTPIYLLSMLRQMFYGYKFLNASNSYCFDAGPRELFVSISLLLPVIGIGIYPDFVFSLSVDKVETILSSYFYSF
ncbi:NAD(P)H-quinone oxidoreductase chain 4, chloroplastic [Linum perenne]